jgi:hypothetical protein
MQEMGLTWRDAVATIVMGAIAGIYATFLGGTSAWLISSARGTTAAVLVLGMVGGCALSAAGDMYAGPLPGPQPRSRRVYEGIVSTGGVAAFATAVIGLITGSTVALAVLVAATFALWLIATTRHALTLPPGPPGSRDSHEVIRQGDVTPH